MSARPTTPGIDGTIVQCDTDTTPPTRAAWRLRWATATSSLIFSFDGSNIANAIAHDGKREAIADCDVNMASRADLIELPKRRSQRRTTVGSKAPRLRSRRLALLPEERRLDAHRSTAYHAPAPVGVTAAFVALAGAGVGCGKDDPTPLDDHELLRHLRR